MMRSGDIVPAVSAETMMQAYKAVASGPRGFENAMLSIVKALSGSTDSKEILAISYRLQGLAQLLQGADLPGFSMKLHGRDYKLVSEAALHAAAICPLSLKGTMAEVQFDQEQFLAIALKAAAPEGSG